MKNWKWYEKIMEMCEKLYMKKKKIEMNVCVNNGRLCCRTPAAWTKSWIIFLCQL